MGSETCGRLLQPYQKTGGYKATQDIPLWLNQTWERVANVIFTYGGQGWPSPQASTAAAFGCATNDGINISDSAQIWANLTVAQGGNFGTALNPDGTAGGPGTCQGNTFMQRWTATHEFGHALGFAHEHDRVDRPTDMNCPAPFSVWQNPNDAGTQGPISCGTGYNANQCPPLVNGNGGPGWPSGPNSKVAVIPGFVFDWNSIMAYKLCGGVTSTGNCQPWNTGACWTTVGGQQYWNVDNNGFQMRNALQNDGFLSPQDVAIVRSIYGKPGQFGLDYPGAPGTSCWPTGYLSRYDADCDHIYDYHDNCALSNPDQAEANNDGFGNACTDPTSAGFDTGPPPVTGAGANGNGIVTLHLTDSTGMAWASLDNGTGGDKIWLEQTQDRTSLNLPLPNTATYVTNYAWTNVPYGGTSWRTMMRPLNTPYSPDSVGAVDINRGGFGKVRACAGASTATPSNTRCTEWYGEDPAVAKSDTSIPGIPTVVLSGRQIKLHVSPNGAWPTIYATAWASIDNSNGGYVTQGDEVYLDRYDWTYNNPPPADAIVPANVGAWRTLMRFVRGHSTYNGWVRACGKAVGNPTPSCTNWYYGG